MKPNRIDQAFQKEHKLLSIYFSAGHPALEDTPRILELLQSSGVDMVEIGLPFSDPLADGPTIQDSSTKALQNGMHTQKLFDQLRDIRQTIHLPLIIMGYFNPMLQYGVERFCQQCADIGIDGLIIPDLPVDVYHEQYQSLFEQHGLYNMFLITPQTAEDRIRYIDEVSKGFIYMVSSASVTGAKSSFGDPQQAYFDRVASYQLKTPRIVGFGISNADTFQAATQQAQGAIIGSAFIKFLENEGVEKIPQFIERIR